MTPDSGILYIVATPIGNLEDITLRALHTLRECNYILCEDTRVTGKLLSHHGIDTPKKRYDAHASERTHEQVLADLATGKHVALVSDAGTPGISDPGVLLVAQARAAGIRVEPIPGPSALIAAFSVAGLPGNQFTFLGFVPHKKGRETFFASLTDYDHPVAFFESTHRIMKTLDALVATFTTSEGNPTITVARELTKLHEEVVQGTPEVVREYFMTEVIHQKGEFVVLVSRG